MSSAQEIRPLVLESVRIEALEGEHSGAHDTFRLASATGAASLPRPLVALVLLFDGQTSIADIDATMRSWGFKPPRPDFLPVFVRQLTRAGLVELRGQQRRVVPGSRGYACLQCGHSCRGEPIGPISPESADKLEAQYAELSRLMLVPPHVQPVHYDEEGLAFLDRPGGQCAFLLNDNRCLIHSHFGEAEKPLGCQLFPLIATEVDQDIRLGFTSRCFRAHLTFDNETPYPLEDRFDTMEELGNLRPLFRRYAQSEDTDASRQHHESFSALDGMGPFEQKAIDYVERCKHLGLFELAALASSHHRPKHNRPLPDAIVEEVAVLIRRWATRIQEHEEFWPHNVRHSSRVAQLLKDRVEHLSSASLTAEHLTLSPRHRSFLAFTAMNQLWIRDGYRIGKLQHAVLFLFLGAAAATWYGNLHDGDEVSSYERFGETLALWNVAFQFPQYALQLIGWRDREKLLKRWKRLLR